MWWGDGRSQEPTLLTVVAWALHSLHGVKVCVGVGGIGGTALAEEGGELFRRSLWLSLCMRACMCGMSLSVGCEVVQRNSVWGSLPLAWSNHSKTCAGYRGIWRIPGQAFGNQCPVPL